MAVRLFNAALGAAFIPSSALLISGTKVALDFQLTVTTLAQIEWYPEFASDAPATAIWHREVAEEDIGNGDVRMPKAIRRFTEFGGTLLASGTHNLSVQLERTHQIFRIQMRIVTGAASVQVWAPFGTIAT